MRLVNPVKQGGAKGDTMKNQRKRVLLSVGLPAAAAAASLSAVACAAQASPAAAGADAPGNDHAEVMKPADEWGS